MNFILIYCNFISNNLYCLVVLFHLFFIESLIILFYFTQPQVYFCFFYFNEMQKCIGWPLCMTPVSVQVAKMIFKCKKYTFFWIQPKYVLLFNSSKYNHNSEHAAIYINTILLTQAKTVYHNNSDGIFQSHVFMN
jgi:hypothetical protein